MLSHRIAAVTATCVVESTKNSLLFPWGFITQPGTAFALLQVESPGHDPQGPVMLEDHILAGNNRPEYAPQDMAGPVWGYF